MACLTGKSTTRDTSLTDRSSAQPNHEQRRSSPFEEMSLPSGVDRKAREAMQQGLASHTDGSPAKARTNEASLGSTAATTSTSESNAVDSMVRKTLQPVRTILRAGGDLLEATTDTAVKVARTVVDGTVESASALIRKIGSSTVDVGEQAGTASARVAGDVIREVGGGTGDAVASLGEGMGNATTSLGKGAGGAVGGAAGEAAAQFQAALERKNR